MDCLGGRLNTVGADCAQAQPNLKYRPASALGSRVVVPASIVVNRTATAQERNAPAEALWSPCGRPRRRSRQFSLQADPAQLRALITPSAMQAWLFRPALWGAGSQHE
jgi:hypothetical protein